MTRERVEYTIVAYLPKEHHPIRDKAAWDAWEAFKVEVGVLQTAARFRDIDFQEAADGRDD